MTGKSFETRLFARLPAHLPELLLAGIVPPLLAALLADGPLPVFLALGVMVAWTLLLLQLALCCWFVRVMKGPRRRADSYHLPAGPR